MIRALFEEARPLMPLTMTVLGYCHLAPPERRAFDAWLEDATATPLAELRARAVTLLDEGGTIEVEREHNPPSVVGDEIETFHQRYAAHRPPPCWAAA